MRQTGKLKTIVTMLAIIVILALLVWAFVEGRKELALEQERERPINVPSRVSIEHGESVITLDVATQKLGGIETARLAPAPGDGQKSSQGISVPDSAVVWLDGKAWVYLQKDSERFVRRDITSGNPVQSGRFVSKNIKAGDRIVTQGAQLLLSEEFRSEIQVGEEGGK